MNCPKCDQPMLPKGEVKRNNEYDHAHGCPLSYAAVSLASQVSELAKALLIAQRSYPAGTFAYKQIADALAQYGPKEEQ